jgi:hypothetical protein
MEQSRCEGNTHSACQGIPCFLWNQVHYHVHKELPPVLIPSLMYSIHTNIYYFFNSYFNTTVPSHTLDVIVLFVYVGPPQHLLGGTEETTDNF